MAHRVLFTGAMRWGDLVPAAWRATWRGLRLVAATLATTVASAAERVAYRKHEVAIVGLLATSVLAGLAVEQWHRRAPSVLERLEAERPRLGAATEPRPYRSAQAPRAPRARPPVPPPPTPAAPPQAPHAEARPLTETPLDLNRATATELMRLPGIGPRLAGRILARRAALGGRFGTADELAAIPGVGGHRAAALRSLVMVAPDPATEPAGSEIPEPETREPP